MKPYLIDTNVFVYAETPDDTVRAARAERVLEVSVLSGRGIISTQVLAEFANVLSRRVRTQRDRHEVAARLRTVSRGWPVRDVDIEVSRLALMFWERCALSFWDAQILAAAIASGCDTIVTEDTHKPIAGVRYVNPFAPGFDISELA